MTTPSNAINESTTGITGFTGTSFTGSPTTQYNVLVGGATSSTLANVAPGSSGNVLTSNGASANPSFQSPTGLGVWVLLQSQAASNSASLDFTTGFSSVYYAYAIVVTNLIPANDSTQVGMQISVDGGSNYLGSGYTTGTNIASSNSFIFSNQATSAYMWLTATLLNSQVGSNCILYLSTVSGSTPTLYGNGTELNGVRFALYTGYNTTTTAVNAMTFLAASGNLLSGSVTIYGIRHS